MRYQGSCHCGAVTFTVSTDLPDEAVACNCSRCRRLGALLTFVPAGDFTLDSGEDALTDYHFNKHVIRHRFCRHCGVQPFSEGEADGAMVRAVNLRCVPACDLGALQVNMVDGASF